MAWNRTTDAFREDIVDIDLQNGTIHRSFLNHTIGKGDILEDRFGVRLFRNGEPMVLDGSECEGFFMAPNGQNIFIQGSSRTKVNDNIAWVQLPQACYNVEGQFTLAIKIIGEDDSFTGTLRIIDGVVSNTGVDGAIEPPDDIPTWAEIIAAYNQMLAAKAGAVRFDIRQDDTLTNAEKARARNNIGAISQADIHQLTNDFYALGLYVDSSGFVCQRLANET